MSLLNAEHITSVMTQTSLSEGGKTMTSADNTTPDSERPIYDVADTTTPTGRFRVVARHDCNQRTYCSHTTWIAAWRCAKFGECSRKGNGLGRSEDTGK